ncbi:MAG: hypothetical protein OER92_03500 [Alphaproteobacteria bacterium]|nr:hypothetical protein [Alphaproteobacteria bacterium]
MTGKIGIHLLFNRFYRELEGATVWRFLTDRRGEVSKEMIFFIAFIAFALVAGFVFTR